MSKIKYIAILVFVWGFLFSSFALAHPGRTDANDCHTNRKTREYHCHEKKNRTPRLDKKAKLKTKPIAKKESRKKNSNSHTCIADIYNCSDFTKHKQAQDVYKYCGGIKNDIHRLDRDEDDLACESLP